MNSRDMIISALYLTKTDNREKMLSDLIINVLHSLNKAVNFKSITEYISKEFHLTPLEFELSACLDALVENSIVLIQNEKYELFESTKIAIASSIAKGVDEADKRLKSFHTHAKAIFDGDLSNEEFEHLWSKFNEYLFECFMLYGRKAINIFTPYKEGENEESNQLLEKAISTISTPKLVHVFKRIIVEYPEKLNDSELRYLNNLASRAEKFYSLGINQDDYQKVKSLNLKDLVVLIDTNIIYSILGLHVHAENKAIFELIKIAKNKLVDFKLQYLNKTHLEFQKVKPYLESTISREPFKRSQIRALVCSDRLDSFSRSYFEAKILNSSLPHPAEKVIHAVAILKDQNVQIYNAKIPQLEEDQTYLNSRIEEYNEFQRHYNKVCDQNGSRFHLSKEPPKIEHDVILRETVKLLRKRQNDESEFRYICITLDRSLIHFDHYSLNIENSGQTRLINPLFILPSQFIKRLRPFLPLETSDYKKAFITSVTAPNIEKEASKDNALVQKTMTYFKNLGIEDEEIILQCIRNDLFLERISNSQSIKEIDEIIQSEVSKEIERVKNEKEALKIEIENQSISSVEAIKKIEDEKIKIQSESALKIDSLEKCVSQSIETIEMLKKKMEQFENKTIEENRVKEKERLRLVYENKLQSWKLSLAQYIQNAENIYKRKQSENIKYCLRVLFLTALPILIGAVYKLNTPFYLWLTDHGIKEAWVWIFLGIMLVYELFFRAYINNKDKVKSGWEALMNMINTKSKAQNLIEIQAAAEHEFIHQNGSIPVFLDTNE